MSTKKRTTPLISIAAPIYNEERHIASALESLLNQTYSNIEILIFDNASTDSTGKICQQYAKKHKNIKYIVSDKNIGAAANYEKALSFASGEYFMWAGGHDLWSSNLVSECIASLQQKPNATLAFGSTYWVDENGELKNKYSGWADTQGLDAVSRFFIVLLGNMHPVLGVIKLEPLKSIRFYKTIGADLLILLQLVLKGDFLHATDASCYRREIVARSNENYQKRMKRYNSDAYNLTGKKSFTDKLPLIKLPFFIVHIVFSAEISILKKLMILIVLLPLLPAKYLLGTAK